MDSNQPKSFDPSTFQPSYPSLQSLRPDERAALLRAVLHGHYDPGFDAWVAAVTERLKLPDFLRPDPLESLFELLAHQSPAWFDTLAPVLEHEIHRALDCDDELLLVTAKALVAETRAGLRDEFFREVLGRPRLSDEHDLDFRLLNVKILERRGEENNQPWTPGREVETIDAERHPHRTPVVLYAFRDTEPLRGLWSCFYVFTERRPAEWLFDYLVPYVRHCVYAQLREHDRVKALAFRDLRKKCRNTEWLDQLLDDALQHPALADIKTWLDGFDPNQTPSDYAEQLNDLTL